MSDHNNTSYIHINHQTSLGPRPQTNPSADCFQCLRVILEEIYAPDEVWGRDYHQTTCLFCLCHLPITSWSHGKRYQHTVYETVKGERCRYLFSWEHDLTSVSCLAKYHTHADEMFWPLSEIEHQSSMLLGNVETLQWHALHRWHHQLMKQNISVLSDNVISREHTNVQF